jgi:predicted transcriptional regulator of viral defense system
MASRHRRPSRSGWLLKTRRLRRNSTIPRCASSASLTEGVEEHVVDGVTVRVTGVAKTVADCFKYRNKIGLDVALEALREAWREKRMTSEDLWVTQRFVAWPM